MEEYLLDENTMADLEMLCIAQKSRTAVIYLYPFVKEVWKHGAKVVTRDGRTVKRVQCGSQGGNDVVVGILDGEELRWDGAGRFKSPYENDPRDLFITERYFRRDWKSWIKLSNAEWAIKFGRPHPYAKLKTER